jgi:L-amino acid N-acyltransferase
VPTPRRPGPVRVRPATLRDVPTIAEIYNEAVRTTTATFDVRPRSLADRRRWFRDHDRRHPVLVGLRGTTVIGWASLSPWSDRSAYEDTAEVSTNVAGSERAHGVGSRLLGGLVRRARSLGFHTLLARVADGNEASLRLHATAGFSPVGVMREVGVKFGRRLDVHLLQLLFPPVRGTVPERIRRPRRPGRN